MNILELFSGTHSIGKVFAGENIISVDLTIGAGVLFEGLVSTVLGTVTIDATATVNAKRTDGSRGCLSQKPNDQISIKPFQLITYQPPLALPSPFLYKLDI